MELEGRRDGKEGWGDILVSPVAADACASDSSDTAVGAVEDGTDWVWLRFNAVSQSEGCWFDPAAKNDWSVWRRASQHGWQKTGTQLMLNTYLIIRNREELEMSKCVRVHCVTLASRPGLVFCTARRWLV